MVDAPFFRFRFFLAGCVSGANAVVGVHRGLRRFIRIFRALRLLCLSKDLKYGRESRFATNGRFPSVTSSVRQKRGPLRLAGLLVERPDGPAPDRVCVRCSNCPAAVAVLRLRRRNETTRTRKRGTPLEQHHRGALARDVVTVDAEELNVVQQRRVGRHASARNAFLAEPEYWRHAERALLAHAHPAQASVPRGGELSERLRAGRAFVAARAVRWRRGRVGIALETRAQSVRRGASRSVAARASKHRIGNARATSAGRGWRTEG